VGKGMYYIVSRLLVTSDVIEKLLLHVKDLERDSSTTVPPLHIATDGRCEMTRGVVVMTINGVSFRLEWNEMEKSLLKRSGRDLSTAVEMTRGQLE
jgi:hypothetical protein